MHSALCPILVGRNQPLATIQYHLNQMAEGQHHAVVISGGAGMGKSRLVAEALSLAAAQGCVILQGQCTELERALAYAPLVDLVRTYCLSHGRSLVQVLRSLGSGGAVLEPLFPEISPPRVASGEHQEANKFRLYQAAVEFCRHAAGDQALVLIIEDLHWSGEASLELLLYLTRHLSSRPVLFLYTYNGDESGPALTHFLAQLDRGRQTTEVELQPLSPEHVDRMVQAILQRSRAIPPLILQTLYRWSEGNPFFVEEILQSMLAAGEILVDQDGARFKTPSDELRIPRGVQDAVQRRSERLTAEARETLTLAAVLGREFDFTLLRELREVEESQLLAQLKELIGAQFVGESSADRFAFRHALTRETVYASLLARERRRLHQKVAERLEQIGGDLIDQRLSDLAYHCSRGQLWPQALRYSQQAGERAMALQAPQSAEMHFSHALEAANQLAINPVHLHYLRGQANAALHRFDAALADFQAALSVAQNRQDRWQEWETLMALGHLWTTRDYARTGEYFRQAHDLARNLADRALVARSLNNIGNWQMNRGLPFAALRDHREALAMFRQLDDASGIATTLDLLAIASYNCADVLQGRTYYHQALPLWRQLGDSQGLLHTLSGLALGADFDLEVDDTPIARAVAWGEESVALARQIASHSGEALSRICLGLALRQEGQYGRALDEFQQALTIAEDIEHHEWMVDARFSLGMLYGDVLALADAGPLLEQTLAMAHQIHSGIWIYYVSAALAFVRIQEQAYDQAHEVLDDVVPADSPMQSLHQRVLWLARAELSLAEGDAAASLQIVDRLIQSTSNLSRETGRVVPRLWLLWGQVLTRLQRLSEAESALRAGLSVAQAQGRRRLLWPLHAALSRVYRAQKQTAAAQAAVSAASREIDTLATSLASASLPLTGSLAEQFRQQASTLLPSESAPSTRQQDRERFGGLTEREREVALLVVQGKSNREIAELLVLSERTAERHIANIMAKLGFNSRAQIAAWVVEKGLRQHHD